MIREAGLGIAMGNAPATVQSAADWVTGTNNEAGVAQAVRRLLRMASELWGRASRARRRRWREKYCPMARLKHRQDAYATLAYRTVERSPRAIPGALAVHPGWRATALM